MKAFQLKIAIKESKPPIWRRLIVPSGITFSQLSIILNEAMGWCGYHSFKFEFYHRQLTLIEEAGDWLEYGPNDCAEASTTLIGDFLSEEDWFTYVYDLGDDWQHRVTIEKVLENYDLNYPQVIKYKGDCPLEDSGGLWGHYENLEIIEDPKHPEYEDRFAWMESQGYPNVYNMEAVNACLREKYFYRYGKREKRLQADLQQAMNKGENGLCATKHDKNTNLAIRKSDRHKVNESLERIVNLLKEIENLEIPKETLADIFEHYSKEDLLEIANQKGLKRVSGLSKDMLIITLTEYMLRPEIIEPYFLCLSDEDIKEFEKVMQAADYCLPEKTEAFVLLRHGAYMGTTTTGMVTVPSDVEKAYRNLQGEVFELKRRKVSWLARCLKTASVLYGITPLAQFEKLMSLRPELAMSDTEIREWIPKLPPEIKQSVIVDDTIYQVSLYPQDGGLSKVQEEKDFYLPALEEIEEYGTKYYSTRSAAAQKFMNFFKQTLSASDEEAELVLGVAQVRITSGGSMQEVADAIGELGMMPEKKSDVEKMVPYLMELWDNTRMVIHRGYTPKEMSEQRKQARKTEGKIISFHQEKIYPNDPCPCGSGKKYKNCCKNKK